MFVLWILTLAWAVVATIIIFRNPLPVPDRGHRLFAVPDRRAQDTVLGILRKTGLPLRFRFKTGSTVQALLWDSQTVIHLVDPAMTSRIGLTGNGISVPVSDPQKAAFEAIEVLQSTGYSAELVPGFADFLPANHLVIVRSNAFLGWVLVFRRHLLKMPRPEVE